MKARGSLKEHIKRVSSLAARGEKTKNKKRGYKAQDLIIRAK